MTNNDLIAMLYEAMHELEVLGSYTYDPDTKWPNVGLKVTSASHAKLAKRIKALLDTEPAEDVSLREENRALRAALTTQENNMDWRLKYIEAKHEEAKQRADVDEADAELVLHKEDRLRLRKENMLLKRLLVTARDVMGANRLVLGEYMGPEYISRLTAEIDAAVSDKP